jgi:hypothetical protein
MKAILGSEFHVVLVRSDMVELVLIGINESQHMVTLSLSSLMKYSKSISGLPVRI